jgi:TolB-like protein/Flp pilus assembly protein TadD
VSVFSELRRRNVFRTALAWLALSWLLLAMANLLFPALGLPLSQVQWLVWALLLALPVTLWFAWRHELTAQGLRRDTGVTVDPAHNTRTARRLDQMTVVLALAALSLTLLRQFIIGHGPEPGTAAAPIAPVEAPVVAARPVDPHSIALLPFENLSPAPDDAYFADGLSEELINVLARVQGLKVTSRSSSFLFRESTLDSRAIAAQLGVANLVSGSVRRQGDSVRISAQLVDAASDQMLWSATFDRSLEDIFRVQEEISQAIADALATSLGVRTVEVAAATQDLQAYELYLRGRQLFALRGSNLESARSLIQQAVERDPGFADAWATLASIEYVLPSYLATPTAEASARARVAAGRALALVPELPAALAVRSRLAADAGERLESLALVESALAAQPNSANSWVWKGLTLLEAGHVRAAHEAFDQARQLDPLSGIQLGWLGATELMQGQYAQARVNLERAHELGWRGPASLWLLKLALVQGDRADIERRYADWLREDGRIGAGERGVHEAVAAAAVDPAQRDGARLVLAEAAANFPGYDWTILHLVLGLTDTAITEALRPKPSSGQLLLMVVWSSEARAFREHPAFLQISAARGLVEFWAEHGEPDACWLSAGPPAQLECDR